jgi:hypothetical protein
MANDNDPTLELSVPEDYETLAAWHNVGHEIKVRLSGSDIKHNFMSVFREIMKTFDGQLRGKEPDLKKRHPDGQPAFCVQGKIDDTMLLEWFKPWDAVTESILERFRRAVWHAICQAVDQHLTDYKDTAIYRQTMEYLDAKLKGQMEIVREHVKLFLEIVHSPPSCYSSTWDKRQREKVTACERTLTETHVDGRATPRPTKRSRKQFSTSTNSVVEQTPAQDRFSKFAANLSTAYEYGLDRHVDNVSKILRLKVIDHLKEENIRKLYDVVLSSTTKDG